MQKYTEGWWKGVAYWLIGALQRILHSYGCLAFVISYQYCSTSFFWAISNWNTNNAKASVWMWMQQCQTREMWRTIELKSNLRYRLFVDLQGAKKSSRTLFILLRFEVKNSALDLCILYYKGLAVICTVMLLKHSCESSNIIRYSIAINMNDIQ